MNSPEEIWEKTMKEVIGEDGPKSVAEAIRRLQAELDRERIARIWAQQQLQSYQDDQKASGLCIRYALNGKSRSEDRWWMGEMDRVRDLAVDRDALAARVERLRSALEYSCVYLDESRLNSIGSGSKAHMEMDSVLHESLDCSAARVRYEAAENALKSVKVQCIGYTWEDSRAGRQFTVDRDFAVQLKQDGVGVEPVVVAPQSLKAALRLIDEAEKNDV